MTVSVFPAVRRPQHVVDDRLFTVSCHLHSRVSGLNRIIPAVVCLSAITGPSVVTFARQLAVCLAGHARALGELSPT